MALNWIFPQYQQNLLRVLYENPSTPLHISELARRAGIDSGNTHRYVREFAEQNLVKLNKMSKMTFVAPNFSNPETAKVFEFFEVDRCQCFLGKNQTYCQALSALTNALVLNIDGIRLVSLFGPCTATDELGRASFETGIDLAIVITNGFHSEELKSQVEEIVNKQSLPFNVSALVMRTREFEDDWKNGQSFVSDLWRDRMLLYGESYFWNQVARLGVPK